MLGLKISPRIALVIVHDLAMTVAAVLASFYIRFEAGGVAERWHTLVLFLPGFVIYAGLIYFLFHLYESKWRFASLPDLMNIVRAATVLAASLLALD
jgi:FlaA1/EpsC-like NDP-sugar epimerase